METVSPARPVLIVICLFFLAAPAAAGPLVRDPAWAGAFYPETPEALTAIIKDLTAKVDPAAGNPPPGVPLKALILPHAGYDYSGPAAAHGARLLTGRTFTRVVLLGPDHRVGFRGTAVTGYEAWRTPLGTIPVDGLSKELARRFPHRFRTVPESDRSEHSLEVILPFLQTVLPDFSLIPLVVGQDDPAGLMRDLTAVVPPDDPATLWVVSSDLSHYLPYDRAVTADRHTLDLILSSDAKAFSAKDNAACGRLPILSLMDLAGRSGWHPSLIHYANSGDTSGDHRRVVGYAAVAYYGGMTMKEKNETTAKKFTDAQGRVLIDLARATIARKLGRPAQPVTIPDEGSFHRKGGTFVTLKIHDQLRGCIGNLSSDESVAEGIRRNALNAAFGDYRFSPLSDEEFDTVDIEVSILTEPAPLAHHGGRDLVSKLRPHVDGVIIRKGHAGATFLPQVWDQLPDAEDFLRHLCMKAGLPADAWTSEDLEVAVYQVQYFEEKK
ncbi:AmmeMemoRadiSam system protein B [Desulfatiferula olefinivorans]